ncbi:helix-turn-helix domain-containing protein [Phaeacidiphilus oryzae]|jgi:hypothetical protein|uniref:helix-turn-helix domain-containing protein n=1 Tax=Phaeacidiphilus oryzae TaxID=348818 RepID=UPI000690504E|nr:helix-turn-helix domain-containing protein [Phaeacidiphilus oryzae]
MEIPELPRALGPELRKAQSSIAGEVIREIRSQVPEFSRPLAGKFGAALQSGVETALAEFADLVEGAPVQQAGGMRVYRALGRAQLVEGRSLDALQAAYRLGARVAWRRYAELARDLGADTEQLVRLAEAVFAHIDGIAAHSVQGYALAQADEAGTLGRRRHRLLELLLARAPRAAVEEAATAVDWPLPERVACVALGGPGEGEDLRSWPALPVAVLADLDGVERCLLVPDPALFLRGRQVRSALRGRGAVIGPDVPLADAGDSLRWARALRARLRERGLLRAEPVDCGGRLPELLMLADPALVRVMTERRLAPLRGLTAKQRQRLSATLLAWLQCGGGGAPAVAARLGIHPQTARQRLRQARGLFGAELEDPDARFELEVALRAELRGGAVRAVRGRSVD